eukprot:5408653-Prymnesium_polylepis.2
MAGCSSPMRRCKRIRCRQGTTSAGTRTRTQHRNHKSSLRCSYNRSPRGGGAVRHLRQCPVSA